MLPEAGATELIFLAAVALIVVGPKDLPVLMRKVGQWIGKMRGLAAEFRSSFEELARQSELDELRKEVEALRNSRDPLTNLHPTFQEVSAGLDPSGFRISEDPFEAAVGAPTSDPHQEYQAVAPTADPHREYPAVGPDFGPPMTSEPPAAPAAKPARAPRKPKAQADLVSEESSARRSIAKAESKAAAAPKKAPAKPRAKRATTAETDG